MPVCLGRPAWLQVRKVMAEDPAQARRMLGSLDIHLLPPKAVADLVVELATNTQHKVEPVPS